MKLDRYIDILGIEVLLARFSSVQRKFNDDPAMVDVSLDPE